MALMDIRGRTESREDVGKGPSYWRQSRAASFGAEPSEGRSGDCWRRTGKVPVRESERRVVVGAASSGPV